MAKVRITETRRAAAYEALDVLVENGFVSPDRCLDVVEANSSLTLKVPEWIALIRRETGTDWASIERVSPTWRKPFDLTFHTHRIKAHLYLNEYVRPLYDPLLAAYYVLKAEKRCLARHVELFDDRLTTKRVTFYDLRATGITWEALARTELLTIMQRGAQGIEDDARLRARG